ncbi:lactaldehyde dehydrogenase [Methanobrevibacter filiformis]|uniref:Lactaldehyde dehydrogenase n=1 Tax=Methanobrevibacter filiformis TaxID=55758 RepID=A0A166CWM1_9EURY|nr:lactaldehyde dehydrogenase [Methanobrevibacter filiformis]KZX17297.1 NADP-dependent glyceraldehyde-3-phosphate dehydrogenase [Methanobrevibacter filiformis]
MKALINGKFIDKDKKIDVINPYTNELIDKVPICTRDDVKIAISSAKKAQNILNDFSAFKLSNALYNAYENLKDEQKKIAKMITAETGKPIKDALFEMSRSVETLKLAAEESKRIYGESIPLDAGLGGKGFFGFTQKLPLGVVACITPFNYPVNLAIHKVAPAIAAKNAVILKPSIKAPLSSMMMAEIINAEFPAGVINTLTGRSMEIGDELTINNGIAKISFTGSVPTGLMIANNAGMKKLTLELGGNDPLIILKDADIEKAVKGAINGSYLYSGQVCMAVKRIIVDNIIADEFIQKFVNATKKLKLGDPSKMDTDIGPLIDENAAKIVESSFISAIDNGATVVCGGKRKGSFFEPTIIDNVSPKMDIVINETFGPVSPIIRVNGVEEAISVANNSDFALQAGIFTENLKEGMKCLNEVEAGTVFLNKQSTFRTDNMPFGGFKSSGIGKEGVKYAVEDMTRTKLIAINLR